MWRFRSACMVAARLFREGSLVFSPIAHSHPLATYALPVSFDFWQSWCMSFLHCWATDLYVLKLHGWEESKGVAAEITEAEKIGLPITYVEEYADGSQN